MKQVAVGIILNGGRVLACRRKRSAVYPLKWEFPGGKIEPGESPQEALVRELHEELGIRAVVGEEFHRQEWVYPAGVSEPARDGAFRVFYFLVPSFTDTPVNHTFEEIRWVRPAELTSMDVLDGNLEAIAKLIGPDGKSDS